MNKLNSLAINSFLIGLTLLTLSCTFQCFSSSFITPADSDWLVQPTNIPSRVVEDPEKNEIIITNGLISRTFRTSPNAATVAFDNLMTGQSVIRGIKPEAILEINGKKYEVGGLKRQPNYAYLTDQWLASLTSDPHTFQFVDYRIGKTKPRFPWKRKRHSQDLPWPPPGASLTLNFKLLSEQLDSQTSFLKDLTVSIHYEIYDGLPVIAKWFTLENNSTEPIKLNSFISEILAAVEAESAVDKRSKWLYPNIHVESDYTFHGMDATTANEVIHWQKDPDYLTQVSYTRVNPCLLEAKLKLGPDSIVKPSQNFESFRVFELIYDTTDRERQGLTQRRMYRTLAPWVTENPLMMHVRYADWDTVKNAIDQCAEVGFEMVILTFGSGFNIENESPAYIEQMKQYADYANSKGIEIGGYSLLASRRVSDEDDVVNPVTGKPGGFATFGNSPCLTSNWGVDYFRKLYTFFPKTGFSLLEHDGSYPGDFCASEKHPGHTGYADSQWKQWKKISDFYKFCRKEGIYLNVPDFYYLTGSNKSGMGYRETNWSLPRAQQVIHTRQNIYDGTWQKTPSMGWMFVPLTQYHGGGAAATIEPLSEHLDHYELMLMSNLGAGVQACYRGPRLYDSDQTKKMVKKCVEWYKRHRDVLEGDVLHLRRADGRDIDYWLNVNPAGAEKGLLMIYNPLNIEVKKTIRVPLYYTGLTDIAKISHRDDKPKEFKLDRNYCIMLPVKVEPNSYTWFVIQ